MRGSSQFCESFRPTRGLHCHVPDSIGGLEKINPGQGKLALLMFTGSERNQELVWRIVIPVEKPPGARPKPHLWRPTARPSLLPADHERNRVVGEEGGLFANEGGGQRGFAIAAVSHEDDCSVRSQN